MIGLDGVDHATALAQRHALREGLAELVDYIDVACRSGALDGAPASAVVALDRASEDANRVLLDLDHNTSGANLTDLVVSTWPAEPCGRPGPHTPHVHGPIGEPR